MKILFLLLIIASSSFLIVSISLQSPSHADLMKMASRIELIQVGSFLTEGQPPELGIDMLVDGQPVLIKGRPKLNNLRLDSFSGMEKYVVDIWPNSQVASQGATICFNAKSTYGESRVTWDIEYAARVVEIGAKAEKETRRKLEKNTTVYVKE